MKDVQRTCCACKQKKTRSQLIRVTLDNNGLLNVNEGKQKLFGRSAYVCKNLDCITLAQKKRSFNRAFKREIPQIIYDELTKYI